MLSLIIKSSLKLLGQGLCTQIYVSECHPPAYEGVLSFLNCTNPCVYIIEMFIHANELGNFHLIHIDDKIVTMDYVGSSLAPPPPEFASLLS